MQKVGLIVIFLVCMGLTFLGIGRKIPIESQTVLLTALKDIAAIIFGVMGAWIAILYPDRLSSVYKKTDNENLKSFDKLISPLLSATGIIAFCLIYNVLRPLITSLKIVIHHKELFRSISYNIILFLTFMLLWNLLISLWPLDKIRREIEEKDSEEVARKHYGGK